MPLPVPPSSSTSSSASLTVNSSSSSYPASSSLGRCSVRVILLNKEELQISIENKSIKVGDLFSTTCEHVGLKETEYFGLAQKKDGEFQFLQLDTKLQKLASKLWKSKNLLNNDKPQLTFHLRVMHYINNIGLLRDRTTRHQYYLQLRENLLSYGQAISEEKCFILASYALQADFGPYRPEQHVGAYFDPREFFPAWVVMRRGQDYITSNLPVMHKDLGATTQGDARVAFIRELSCPPICHNFHFYRLRRRKYDSAATIWLAICPRGLEIHEEVKDFKNLLSVFYWQNIEKLHHDKKKFEIVTDSVAERKFTYYVSGKEWGEHLLALCRSSHHFQMLLQPRLLEMQHHEAQDQRFREMYVHGEDAADGSSSSSSMQDARRWQMQTSVENNRLSSSSSVTSQSLASSSGGGGVGLSTVPENAATKTPNAKGVDVQEIMIVSPPLMSSTLTTISPMSDLLPQSSLWSNSGDLQTPSGRNSVRSFRRLPSSGHQGALRGAGSFIAKHNLASSSSSKPSNSSVESLMAYTLSNSNSPSVGRTQPSLSSSPASSPMKHQQQGARDDAKSWMASSSVNSTPSWRSASPNSSTGSGGLLFSLPPKQTLVDAASLRKSLPHGTTLNEYISRIFAGEEDTQFVTSGFNRLRHRRKSSVDDDGDDEHPGLLSFATTGDVISRSTSLRQPNEMRAKTEKKGGVAPPGGGGGGATHLAASLLPVQSLPQMPVPAQVQRIVFPEKMTAISTSVRRPQGGGGRGVFGEPLPGSHSTSSYSTEEASSPGAMVHQPLHSTPIPSRYQLHQPQVHHVSSNIPMLPVYGTPVSLRYDASSVNPSCAAVAGGNFDPSLTVPSYAFPTAAPVITATEVDYRGGGGKLTTSILDYTRPATASGLSVFNMSTGGVQPLFFTSTPTPLAQDPLLRSDPPAYHEWQAAAQAMASFQNQRQQQQQQQQQQPTDEQNADRYAFEFLQNLIGDDHIAAADSENYFLSLSSYYPNAHSHNVPDYGSENRIPAADQVTYDLERGTATQGVGELDVGHLPERSAQSVSTSEKQLSVAAGKLSNELSAVQLVDASDARTNIREKLRHFGPSDLPMIKALLTDKSLLNYPSQTADDYSADGSHRSKSSAATPRPVSWHIEQHQQQLRRNGGLTLSCADELGLLTDAGVKPVSNGDVLGMNGHLVLSDGQVRRGGQQQVNGLRQHASDVVKTTTTTTSSRGVGVSHSQSQSDSVTLVPWSPAVANEC